MGRIIQIFVAVIVAAFTIAGVVWFIVSARARGTFSAGDAFIGLGYLAAALAISLVAIAFLRLLSPPLGAPVEASNGNPGRSVRPPRRDRDIVVAQLRYGTVLVAFGSTLGVVFGVVLDDPNGVAVAMGTAAIGAGAALIPSGAAASASARILSSLPGGGGDGDTGATGTRTASEDGEADGTAATGETALDAAGAGENVVDETEAYGSRSPVTGLADEDLDAVLSGSPLEEQETEADAGAEEAELGETEPGEPEAGVSAIATADGETATDEDTAEGDGAGTADAVEDDEVTPADRGEDVEGDAASDAPPEDEEGGNGPPEDRGDRNDYA